MRVLKYKIQKTEASDETFLLTRATKSIVVSKFTQEVDENGNMISARQTPIVEPPTTSNEETLTAIGLPSQAPAIVVVLETDKGLTEEGIKDSTDDVSRMRPISIDSAMRSGIRKVNPNDLSI